MRVLLTNYLGRDWRPADINDLDGGPIASSRSLFDWTVGIKSSHLNDDEADAFRPALYRFVASRAAKPVVMKVHDAWFPAPSGEPLFPAEATRTVIYIVRNPLDVAVSWAHHYDVDLDRAVEALLRSRQQDRRERLWPITQLRQRLGTWSEHDGELGRYLGAPCTSCATRICSPTRRCLQRCGRGRRLVRRSRQGAEGRGLLRFERLRAQEEEADFRERRGGCPSSAAGAAAIGVITSVKHTSRGWSRVRW